MLTSPWAGLIFPYVIAAVFLKQLERAISAGVLVVVPANNHHRAGPVFRSLTRSGLPVLGFW